MYSGSPYGEYTLSLQQWLSLHMDVSKIELCTELLREVFASQLFHCFHISH